MPKFRLTARSPRMWFARRFESECYTVEKVAHYFAAMRKSFPDYHITVENTAAGFVHTFQTGESFSAAAIAL